MTPAGHVFVQDSRPPLDRQGPSSLLVRASPVDGRIGRCQTVGQTVSRNGNAMVAVAEAADGAFAFLEVGFCE